MSDSKRVERYLVGSKEKTGGVGWDIYPSGGVMMRNAKWAIISLDCNNYRYGFNMTTLEVRAVKLCCTYISAYTQRVGPVWTQPNR
jgi:hypothetical protein